ncbi:hypothetical protein ACLOJK_029991 [Asimina triloba]
MSPAAVRPWEKIGRCLLDRRRRRPPSPTPLLATGEGGFRPLSVRLPARISPTPSTVEEAWSPPDDAASSPSFVEDRRCPDLAAARAHRPPHRRICPDLLASRWVWVWGFSLAGSPWKLLVVRSPRCQSLVAAACVGEEARSCARRRPGEDHAGSHGCRPKEDGGAP